MDELTIGEQKYISSKRAAEITGYAKDYVGQLCREGRVEARLVGRSWYVREASIRDHRFKAENEPENDVEHKEAVVGASSVRMGWESPKYEPEIITEIPILKEKERTISIETESTVPLEVQEEDISDISAKMQEAWEAWFAENSDKKETRIPITRVENSLEDPHIEEEYEPEEEEETPVELTRVKEAIEKPQTVTIVKTTQDLQGKIEEKPLQGPDLQSIVRPRRYVSLRIVLILVALSSVGIGIFGTGIIQPEGNGLFASVIKTISGEKVISK
jgi:hypothetical protein